MGNKQNKKRNNKEKGETKEIIEKEKYKYNILFVGESGIGTKTSLIKTIMKDQFIDNRKVQHLIYEKKIKK